MANWRLRFSALFLVAAVCATSGASAQSEIPAKIVTMEDTWRAAMDEMDVPGFAVAVATKDGIVYSKGFGLRSLDPEEPFTGSTSTYIASVTKVFVTMAVMQLVEYDRIELDAPVKTYLPRFQLSDEQLTETITIRDLLCHRYGINNSTIVFADAYAGHINDDLFYRELPNATIEGEWSYTNVHFTILGRVIEAVTALTWKDYLNQYIFDPAGMTNTTAYASELYGGTESADPLAFTVDGWEVSDIRKIDETMHAAGGMGSSAEDLARWTQIHLNGGTIGQARLLSSESVNEILSVQTESNSIFMMFGRPEMGLGWYIGRYNREVLVHHFGSYVGAHAHCSFMPEHGIGVAVVANSNEGAATLVHQVAADVYDAALDKDAGARWPTHIERTKQDLEDYIARLRENAPQPGPLDLSLLIERYAGTYTSDTWGVLTLRAENGTLVGSIGNIPLKCYPGEKDVPIAVMYLGSRTLTFEIADGKVIAAELQPMFGGTPRYERTGN